MGVNGGRATELRWVFRPSLRRSPEVRDLSGLAIHSFAALGADKVREVVLIDGTRLRVTNSEIVAE